VSLELGAADYITKPFNFTKLLAHIRALYRTREEINGKVLYAPEVITIDGLHINLPNYSVTVENETKVFPKKEFEVLAHLATNRGRVISRQTLLAFIWGEDFNGIERTIDVHVRKIREKLGKYGYLIETVKKVGYRFKQ
jgi:DNA-binding response OmpR family regulator